MNSPLGRTVLPITSREFFHEVYDRFFRPITPWGIDRFAEAYAKYCIEALDRDVRDRREK